jgi:glucokinase
MSKKPSKRQPRSVLLADIGGTNARFAILMGTNIGRVTRMAASDHRSFPEALNAYLNGLPDTDRPGAAVLAAAGVIANGRCALTNSSWVIDADELRATYDFTTVRLVNDFEAVAWSLPVLSPDKLRPIGGGRPVAGAPLAAIGPGTGLGMAYCLPHAAGYLVRSSEGGHATLAGRSAREDAVIDFLRRRYGHVSAERVLSGHGLENLYEALASIDAATPSHRRAAEITEAGVAGTCPTSRAALDMFCALLGTVAGNLVLTLGARGGLFLGGGMLRRLPDYVANSVFRARFEDKGRFAGYLKAIPAYLILDEEPAFLGLRALAEGDGIG